jgi:hypothetical protein
MKIKTLAINVLPHRCKYIAVLVVQITSRCVFKLKESKNIFWFLSNTTIYIYILFYYENKFWSIIIRPSLQNSVQDTQGYR